MRGREREGARERESGASSISRTTSVVARSCQRQKLMIEREGGREGGRERVREKKITKEGGREREGERERMHR